MALTLWVGALWAIGYIAVPLLGERLADPALTAALTEQLYSVVAYLGLACGLFLIFTQVLRTHPWWRNWRLWLVGAMWLLTALNEFVLREWLPAAGSGVHLVVSFLGLALVGFGLQPEQPPSQGFPTINVGRKR